MKHVLALVTLFAVLTVSLLSCNQTPSETMSQAALEDGAIYTFTAKHSGLNLEVPSGATTNGLQLVQATPNASPAQQFRLEAAGSGSYRIINQASGKALDIDNGAKTNGLPLRQWDKADVPWHTWTFSDRGDGYYLIKNVSSGLAIDVLEASSRSQAKVIQWAEHGGDNQRWKLSKVTASPQPVEPEVPGSRDPWLWPFASDSIWNTPIGSGARFENANLEAAENIGVDPEYFIRVNANDPTYPLYQPGGDGNGFYRCRGAKNDQFPNGKTLQFPKNFVVGDSTRDPYATPNNVATLLQPDGRTLLQLQPLARCQADGPVYGWAVEGEDLYGQGERGTHFGSGLSGIGGSLRLGELTSDAPIRHVLKINLWAKKYLYLDPRDAGADFGQANYSFRWPADRNDSYAGQGGYGGSNPKLRMGALLAIPGWVSEADLNLKTPAARKLFRALQDYGAYIVDDTAWNNHSWVGEIGLEEEFQNSYGYAMSARGTDFFNDSNALFQALQIVDNNSPSSKGGGGTPRVPLAPPLR